MTVTATYAVTATVDRIHANKLRNSQWYQEDRNKTDIGANVETEGQHPGYRALGDAGKVTPAQPGIIQRHG